MMPTRSRRYAVCSRDLLTLIRAKELFGLFEEAVDSCEDVADVIHGVILERI